MPFPTPKPASADVGVVGLAVMGQNLALNIADHGFATAVYNRTTSVTDEMLAEHPPGSFGDGYRGRGPGSLVPAAEMKDFVNSLKRPRVAVMLIKAGKATDAVIDALAEHMEPGDVIVDGGNAHWDDTARREKDLKAKGLLFVGSGVSGGELGARFGPSLMPGGDPEAWAALEPVWTAIAAKVDATTGKPIEGEAPGKPVDAPGAVACTAHIGPGAAGHFVKMVHNGIEYADMQMIAEACALLRGVLGLDPAKMAEVFAAWNTTELDSFLIEITADILGQADPVTGAPFVDIVLDTAGQKGTGRWTSEAALLLGVPAPTIAEAVFARAISAQKDLRVAASGVLRGPVGSAFKGNRDRFIEAIRRALYCSKVCAYAQGFAMMAEASDEWEWDLDFASIAGIWRGGCIIRARLLHTITQAYTDTGGGTGNIPNLLMAPTFVEQIGQWHDAWREVVATAAAMGVPVPAFSSALAYYDALRTANGSANIIQAQRDYFGAHTYERTDTARGTFFHLDWPHPERPQHEA
ncbi:MAG: NADP-dependent phosphogluconate dehydrogenase [Planctomycetota bacterium]|nr:NADP-dependent phosphogluconate dehydrogenase [Planctomycetota bacterium]